ncbi:hypothetical protein RFI_23043, partial [Reticulomyxa filosa]
VVYVAQPYILEALDQNNDNDDNENNNKALESLPLNTAEIVQNIERRQRRKRRRREEDNNDMEQREEWKEKKSKSEEATTSHAYPTSTVSSPQKQGTNQGNTCSKSNAFTGTNNTTTIASQNTTKKGVRRSTAVVLDLPRGNAKPPPILKPLDLSTIHDWVLHDICERINVAVRLCCVKGSRKSFMETALAGGCKLLHFVGYADSAGYLLLESSSVYGKGKWVSHLELSSWIDPRVTKCVFIQTPTPRSAANTFLKAGVKHVVSVKLRSNGFSSHATQFTLQFYNAILNGCTIQRAFDTARHIALMGLTQQESEEISSKFRLWPPSSTDIYEHELALFPNLVSGSPIDKSQKLAWTNILPTRPFLGRWIDMQTIMSSLSEFSALVVHGADGIGRKSTVGETFFFFFG